MVSRKINLAIILALFLLALSLRCHAETEIWVNLSNNSAPSITSIYTFSSYTDDSNNSPSTNFSSPNNRTVYIQIKAHDNNSYLDIRQNGFVAIKIVLWNGTNQTDFARFGSSYVNATFESGSGTEGIYTYSFLMDPNDDTRLGTETPPEYYRVLAIISDGTDTAESDNSTNQSGIYTYQAQIIPGPPPVQVLFDVAITVPENKRTVIPGDSFYATVEITKVSPSGLDDITITYSLLNPNNQTVDYSTEIIAINDTVYRIPTLYVPGNASIGTYTFQVVVLYLGVGTWTRATFEVVSGGGTTTTTTTSSTTTTIIPSTTTTTRHHGGGGGGGGESRETTTTTASTTATTMPTPNLFFYSVPADFFVLGEETKPLMVIIGNNGSAAAYGVTLDAGEPMITVKRIPESADILPGERKIFILEIKAADGAGTGLYDSAISIVSPTHLEKHIKFTVLEKPGDERKRIINKIEETTKLKEDVEKEAERIGQQADVSDVIDLLEKSNEKLVSARNHLSTNNYTESIKEISDAVSLIEDSVFKLSKIRQTSNQTQTQTQKPGMISIVDLNIPLLIIVLLLLLLLVLEGVWRKKKGRKLEETYELKRIKDLVFDKLKTGHGSMKAVGESNKGLLNLGEKK